MEDFITVLIMVLPLVLLGLVITDRFVRSRRR